MTGHDKLIKHLFPPHIFQIDRCNKKFRWRPRPPCDIIIDLKIWPWTGINSPFYVSCVIRGNKILWSSPNLPHNLRIQDRSENPALQTVCETRKTQFRLKSGGYFKLLNIINLHVLIMITEMLTETRVGTKCKTTHNFIGRAVGRVAVDWF
mgnify:CR=1 FL=1